MTIPIKKFFKGALIGLIVILPGISGGTVLLVLGLYEKLVRDLSRLILIPWLPFLIGMGGGILLSGWIFAWLFRYNSDVILAFLFGCILASVKTVLGENYRPNLKHLTAFFIGFIIAFSTANIGDLGTISPVAPNKFLFFAGGAVASAAMILPGIPGSAVLILMGIYEDIMLALAEFNWLTLGIFGLGSVIGIVTLSNALDKVYSRHRSFLSWLFVGLIIGSSRVFLPNTLDNPLSFVIPTVLGFLLVWKWDAKNQHQN